jgi:hypothetical protein
VRPEKLGKLIKLNYLIRSRARDLPTCSISPQRLCYQHYQICYNLSCTTDTGFNGSQRIAVNWFGQYLTMLLRAECPMENQLHTMDISEWEKRQWWSISLYVWRDRAKSIKFCSQINCSSIQDSGRYLNDHKSSESFEPNTRNSLTSGAWHGALPSYPPRVYFCTAINLAACSQTDGQPHGICRRVQKCKISIKYTKHFGLILET